MDNQKTAIRTTYFSIVGNTCLAIIKWTAGFFGNSYALIADAIESTTDILSSLLVLFGIKYSNKPADKNHPYGHGRAETLVTFLVVGFLITSATIIAYESILNIGKPHELPKPFTLYVLGAIIVWKEISFQYVIKKSKQTNSTSLKADKEYLTKVRAYAIDMETATIFSVGFFNKIPTGALLLVSDQPMVPDGVKTEASDKKVTDEFVERHLKIGIDSLKQLINNGQTVRHLRFE